MRPRLIRILICILILSAAPCGAQELAELARRERARRAAAGPVRYSIDNTAHQAQFEAATPARASQDTAASSEARKPSTYEQKASAAAGRDKRLDDLARRGPVVWLELKKINQRLADLEKELIELERTSTPTWRRGVMLVDPELVKKRREVQACRRRGQELDQEWRLLQDRARYLGLDPGVLRGLR
jgi:hypothetical protein